MTENEFLIALGAFGVLLGVAWWTSLKLVRMEIQQNAPDLEPLLAQLIDEIQAMAPQEMGDLADIGSSIKDAITDTVEEVLGEMHVPTGMDHILGAVSAFVQARFLNSMPKEIGSLENVLGMVNEGESDSL